MSHLGPAFVLMLRSFFPECVMSTDLLSFEHPSVLLFYCTVLYIATMLYVIASCMDNKFIKNMYEHVLVDVSI